MRRSAFAAVAVAVMLGACSTPEAPRPVATTHATLGGGVVARVGSSAIPSSLVARIASTDRIDAKAALDLLVDDALAAEGAHASAEDRKATVAWPIEALLARATTDRLIADARAAGPPTDAELADATARHWRELDLPEQVRVIHAVVVRPKSAADFDRARAVAAQIAASEATAADADDFEKRAKTIPHDGVDVEVQRLAAFVADGDTSEGEPAHFAVAFARGAFALAKPGDTSSVVESPSGWHVIRLLQRLPPHVVSVDERRTLLADEITTGRAHQAMSTLMASLRGKTTVEIRSDALEQIASLGVQ